MDWITRRAQDRRATYELRRELVMQMTETAGSLVYAIGHYRRVKRGVLGEEIKSADIEPALHEQYHKTRTSGKVLEVRLQAYFESDTVRKQWHRTIDLLAMRYWHALGRPGPGVRRKNAGEEHSGLSVEELENEDMVEEHYHKAMDKVIGDVLTAQLKSMSYRRTRRKSGRASGASAATAANKQRSLTPFSRTGGTKPDSGVNAGHPDGP